MKKMIPVLLLLSSVVQAAEVKFSELPAASAVTSDDLVPMVNDPAGTPATQKATAAQVATFVLGSDAEAAALIGLTSAADRLPYFTGSGSASLATFTSFGRSLVDDADATAGRSTLGVVIGTNVQAFDADLSAYAAAPVLSGTTGSIGGGALLAGACTSGTVSVTSSTTAMSVVATPVTYPGDGTYWMGYVSTNGTVTVKVCAAVALTPGATNYNVRVIQ